MSISKSLKPATMSMRAAAEYIGTSVDGLRRRVRDRKVAYTVTNPSGTRTGKRYRFSIPDLDAYLSRVGTRVEAVN